MWSPKLFAPPPNQRTQSSRPHRPSPIVSARRFITRGFRTTRKRVEQWNQWHNRGCVFVQQLVDSIFSHDLLVDELLGDYGCFKVKTVLGTLLSGGLAPKPKSEEKEDDVKEQKFLVCEIRIVGVDGELKEIAKGALTIKENLSYTLSEVNEDLEKVLKTGFFNKCKASPEDTRDGILLRINVEPNPQITRIVQTGSSVLPQIVFEQAVQNLLGKPLNNVNFEEAVRSINDWYISEGLVGEVCDAGWDEPTVPVFRIQEAIVNRIDLRYHDAVTGDLKEEGNVKPEVVLRYMGTRPGAVMNNLQAQRDVEAIFATGLFADVKLMINIEPAKSTLENPRLDILLDVYENRKTGGLGFGAGWSGQSLTEGSLPGFVGNIEYIEKNMFGLGQRLISRLEFGQVDKLFKVEYNEPWIIGNKHRTSRTFGVMNTRTSGNPFYALAESATGIQRFKTVIGRLMGSFTMSRALTENWSGTVGMTAQRITLMDDNSRAIRQDFTRAPVNVSGAFHDLMLAPFFKAAFTGWANSHFMLMAEKAIPIRPDWLGITKASARAEKITSLGPVSLVLCAKGGATIGKVPPYEAFPLGGINSIRGYREGSVGTARHFVEGTAEIRFPMVSSLQGVVFVDCGSDLDTGSSVVGNPGHSRNKPGKGAGFGLGVRVNSPVGPLRLEWAWNDKGSRLFHAGFGDHR